jgi:uncharacterized protein YcaQ
MIVPYGVRVPPTDNRVALSDVEARRLALNAQRFGRARPRATPNVGHVERLVADLGAVQLDAVNVLVRSHYLPLYSRLGPYPTELLDRAAYRRRSVFEYWGHAASFLPTRLHPAVRWRMRRYATGKDWTAVVERIERERPGYLARVEQEIADRGPLTYGDLSDPAPRDRVPTKYAESSLLWYRWSDGKTALEGLYSTGRLAVAGRRGFERLYDLTERVIPPEVLAVSTPEPEDAQRALVRHAAAALGVATTRDLADYFRLPVAMVRARARELVDSGELSLARVESWPGDAFLDPGVSAGPVAARALLSPFDSLIWERERTARLFGFQHSFELYVPAAKRRYGYYVLPFLLGEALVARVDLKADQRSGTLLVQAAHAEPGLAARRVAGELAEELRDLARWLSVDTITVVDRGDLAGDLRRALR